jgi:hypothetical protein
MRKELINELRQRHPRLLGPMGEPAIQPSILCGDGWFNIIDCLCASISSVGESFSRIEEVKAKYGSLRVYAIGLGPGGNAQVELAESLSERTCEECGCPGVPRSRAGWITTRCHAHQFFAQTEGDE